MIDFANVSAVKTSKRRHARRPRDAQKTTPAWHAGYLQMLPAIRCQALRYLRNLSDEARDDALQEIIADTVVVYARLAELGKQDLAFSGPLVKFAVAKFRAGRRVGNRLNVRNVMSEHCQLRKRIIVERLDRFSSRSGAWREILVEDRHASPAEIAAMRVDFYDWLRTLTTRNRHIAERLALGETSGCVARMFSISTGRISQLRHELRQSWYTFTETLDAATSYSN